MSLANICCITINSRNTNTLTFTSKRKQIKTSNYITNYMSNDRGIITLVCVFGFVFRIIMKEGFYHQLLFTLNIFYCSIRNNWIGHKFHNLETSSPIHTWINTKWTYIILYTYFILSDDMKKTKAKTNKD
jgi:hypothetical protein